MARSDLLVSLVKAGTTGDKRGFHTAAEAIIAEERAKGTSILLVEQNARKALALADHAYVLERGRITLQGSGSELLGREEITAAYLGEGGEI